MTSTSPFLGNVAKKVSFGLWSGLRISKNRNIEDGFVWLEKRGEL